MNRRRKELGYVLAIPEFTDLDAYVDVARKYWKSLDPVVSGYRPSSCFIDVPEEAGLEFLLQVARRKVENGRATLIGELLAVEWYQLER